mmetsp:Transcript_8235/g.24758  ORF Transcript_8235/g.24758 Transcript_8235/m.24758 type:complete len:173 (-) Transcript_8235:1563-2081(-)
MVDREPKLWAALHDASVQMMLVGGLEKKTCTANVAKVPTGTTLGTAVEVAAEIEDREGTGTRGVCMIRAATAIGGITEAEVEASAVAVSAVESRAAVAVGTEDTGDTVGVGAETDTEDTEVVTVDEGREAPAETDTGDIERREMHKGQRLPRNETMQLRLGTAERRYQQRAV